MQRTAQISEPERAARARVLDARMRDLDELAERMAAKPAGRRS